MMINRSLRLLLPAQFLSSLADSALLIAAIALLLDIQAAPWMTPALKLLFNGAYVLLAVAAGACADALPKSWVMVLANAIKAAGCALMLLGMHPLAAYALVGLGAALYSPAKFGILGELLPARQLVAANGWLEGTTIIAIILGSIVGGLLLRPDVLLAAAAFIDEEGKQLAQRPAHFSIAAMALLYLAATVLSLFIPRPVRAAPRQRAGPGRLTAAFARSARALWSDPLSRISLAVTALFWGAGTVLQFIVLKWAAVALGYSLGQAAMLQGAVAVGVAAGAFAAGRFVPLKKAFRVLPLGILMGLLLVLMIWVSDVRAALALLLLIGFVSGYFLIPMNAVLQHRAQRMMHTGQSIAVQNFLENLAVLGMLAGYAALVWLDVPVRWLILLLGGFIAAIMVLLTRSLPHEGIPMEAAPERAQGPARRRE